MKREKRKFSGVFKAQVAIAALKERETLAELSKRYDIHQNIISKWKQEFINRSQEIFEAEPREKSQEDEKQQLFAKIGELEMHVDFLKKNLKKVGL